MSLKSNFDSFIFDMDGTIADTEEIVLRAVQRALQDEGKAYETQELHFVFGIPSMISAEHFGVADIPEFVRRWTAYEDTTINDAPVFEGFDAVLAALHRAGKKMGVVTSRTRGSYDRYVQRLGYGKYFPVSYCYGETEQHKPCPEPLLKCMSDLGADAGNTIYIGDSNYDMECALSSGATFGLAHWGAESSRGFEKAHYVLKHPADILALL